MKKITQILLVSLFIFSFNNVNAAPPTDWNLPLPDLTDASDNGVSNSDNITTVDPRVYKVECPEVGKYIRLVEYNGHQGFTTSWQECIQSGIIEITTGTGIVSGRLYEVNYNIADDNSGTNQYRSDKIGVIIGDGSGFPVVLDKPNLLEIDDSGYLNSDDKTNILNTNFQVTCKENNEIIHASFRNNFGRGTNSQETCTSTGQIITFSNPNTDTFKGEYHVFVTPETSLGYGIKSETLTVIGDDLGPVLTEVTSIITPSSTDRPSYTFNYNDDFLKGSLVIGGSCSTYFTDLGYVLVNGNKTIRASSNMPNGIYSDCTLISTDEAGNISNTLNITSFEINKIRSSHGRTGPIDKIDICNYTKGDKSGDYHDGICTKDGQKAEGIDICESGDTSGNFYDKICDKKGTKSGKLKKENNDDSNEKDENNNQYEEVKKVVIEEMEEFSEIKEGYKKLLEEKYSWLLKKFKGKNLENILNNIDKLILETRNSNIINEKKLSKIALLTAFRELLLEI